MNHSKHWKFSLKCKLIMRTPDTLPLKMFLNIYRFSPWQHFYSHLEKPTKQLIEETKTQGKQTNKQPNNTHTLLCAEGYKLLCNHVSFLECETAQLQLSKSLSSGRRFRFYSLILIFIIPHAAADVICVWAGPGDAQVLSAYTCFFIHLRYNNATLQSIPSLEETPAIWLL